MKIFYNLKSTWLKLPGYIRKLLIMGGVALMLWKLLYSFWLEPDRILDRPLTLLVAKQSVFALQTIIPQGNFDLGIREIPDHLDHSVINEHVLIMKDGKPTISIADNCNGLQLLVLYAFFILIMPGSFKRKIGFIVFGVLILHISNITRVLGLVGLHLKYPGAFDFSHHYLFKIIIYGLSFFLWVRYLNPKTKPIKNNG